jgi:hypothetical protein
MKRTKKAPVTLKNTMDNAIEPAVIILSMFGASAVNKLINSSTEKVAGLGNAMKIATPLVFISAGLLAPQFFSGKTIKSVSTGIAAYGIGLGARQFFNQDILAGISSTNGIKGIKGLRGSGAGFYNEPKLAIPQNIVKPISLGAPTMNWAL